MSKPCRDTRSNSRDDMNSSDSSNIRNASNSGVATTATKLVKEGTLTNRRDAVAEAARQFLW